MFGNQNWSDEEEQLLRELVTAKPRREPQVYDYWHDITEEFEAARIDRHLTSGKRSKDAIRKKWNRLQEQAQTGPVQDAGSTIGA